MKRTLITIQSSATESAIIDAIASLVTSADEFIISPPPSPPSFPAAASIYAALRNAKFQPRLLLARNLSDALEHLCRSWKKGDTTTYLTAKDTSLITAFKSAVDPCGILLPALPPVRYEWIGQGTNTWRSDLKLNRRYRHTKGPANALGCTLGIPWMAGIPGTIGGWIKMNAGAFGHSISEALEAVCIDGVWRPATDCGFAYRHSDITGEIQDFRLRPLDEIASEGDAAFYLQRRRKFPAGTFGSFFKNPAGQFAGQLLENAGVKNLRVGEAFVWQEHANVIVAPPKATPSDVLALSQLMAERVFAAFGIRLEPEVCGIAT